jgi:hypothetical protein
MAILQLTPIKIGQAGVQPTTYKMLSTDDLPKIIEQNYIRQGSSGSFFSKNDIVELVYNYKKPNSTNARLWVDVEPGTNKITLTEFV